MRHRDISENEKTKFKIRINPDEIIIHYERNTSRNLNNGKTSKKSKNNYVCRIKDAVNRFLLPILLSGAGSGLYEIIKLIVLVNLIAATGTN